MSDFNDFGFSTVSVDEYEAEQKVSVDREKEVVTTATASIQPELDKIEQKYLFFKVKDGFISINGLL